MKKVFPILVSLIVAGIATAAIVKSSATQQMSVESLNIVFAAREIAPGQVLTRENLAVRNVPVPSGNKDVYRRLMTGTVDAANLESLIDRRAKHAMVEGEPVFQNAIDSGEQAVLRDWKDDVPEGMRAMSIPVDNIAAVSGLVEVGDRVDILVTMAMPDENAPQIAPAQSPVPLQDLNKALLAMGAEKPTKPMTFYLLENVEILAAGKDTYRRSERRATAPDLPTMAGNRNDRNGAVTIAVTPAQAPNLALAVCESSARFTLTLRRAGDKTESGRNSASLETFVRMFKGQ